jgi:hypothetical protein
MKYPKFCLPNSLVILRKYKKNSPASVGKTDGNATLQSSEVQMGMNNVHNVLNRMNNSLDQDNLNALNIMNNAATSGKPSTE